LKVPGARYSKAFHRKVALAPATTTPEEMANQLRKDYTRFGKIIQDYGIKAD
jgi:tripartite-type tricarboxylate transporter receptor subunit TctC